MPIELGKQPFGFRGQLFDPFRSLFGGQFEKNIAPFCVGTAQ
jgi:hypothetical protein